MSTRFAIKTIFSAVDRITAPVKRMQDSVSKFTKKTLVSVRKLNRSVDRMGNTFKRMAVAATAAATATGVAFGKLLGAGADFEQAITDVGAVTLQTREQIKPLEDLALKLGASTKFTATQAANAMEVLARAGFNTNDILSATPGVLSAAAASGLEIAEVANHVSNVMKGLGLETSETVRVADVLALASSRTNSSIGSLGESMKNVASTARQLNVPLEEVVAGVALLQDVGLDASVAGSALNVMLTKMAAPSAKIKSVMRRVGISFKDAEGNMLPFADVLEQLNIASKAAGGNFDQVAFLAELVGLRGQKAAANLGQLFESGKFSVLSEELRAAAGSAERMAKIRMDTTKGSILLLGSAIDAVKVKIFDMNSGALKDTVDSMTKWVSANEGLIATKIGTFISDLINNLGNIYKWIKRIGTALGVFIVFSTVLKSLIAVLTLVNLVMAANPIALIVLGVMAAIAAFTALVVWIDDVIAAFDKMPAVIKAILFPLRLLLQSIKFVKDAFSGGFGSAFDKLKQSLGLSVEPDVNSTAAPLPVKTDNVGALLRNLGDFQAQVASPQERTARLIEERRENSSAEVTIRDETGRAETTKGPLPPGVTVERTGGL